MTTALVKNPGVTAPEIREHHPAKFEATDWLDYPCLGGCGFWLSEPYVTCGSCQVRQTMKSAHDQRARDEREKLVVTERRIGPFVIRTCGYGIYVETLGTSGKPYPYGHLLNAWDADVLAEVLRHRAAFVRSLESPYRPKTPMHGTWHEILRHHQGPPLLEAFSSHLAALEGWEAEGGACLAEPPSLLAGWPAPTHRTGDPP